MEEPGVIYEDKDIVVVDKPAGMIVYPDHKHDYPALSHWLEKRYPEHHFVHRIDRETSGVLLVAKSKKAHEFFKKQFQGREAKKVYRAFVYGKLDERGIIEKPIGSARGGRGPRSAKNPYGVQREAMTIYRSIASTPEVTYVEAFPQTGRTHQIRVHMAAVQHPIVADTLYASRRPKLLGFERLALHALSLSVELPGGSTKTFEAPLPADFVAAQDIIAGKGAL
jgi:23S rRNA pseudouridine1911/1915/1917 synthase